MVANARVNRRFNAVSHNVKSKQRQMKAKDLIKILENVPDFDVVVTLTTETPNEGWGVKYTNFDVKDYNDTGHSDKVIMFEIEERT